MRLRLNILLLLAIVLLVASMPIMVSAEEQRQIEITWIQKGPTVYKAVILFNGTATNITAQVIGGGIKIIEINGAPQNSCEIGHPLLFKNTENIGGRWITRLRGVESIIIQGLLPFVGIEIPYWHVKSRYIYIHLDKYIAPNPSKALPMIYYLVSVCFEELWQKGYVEESYKVNRAKYPLWTLKNSEYLNVYRRDANPDGSIDFVIPLDYPTQVATRYSWWCMTSGYATWACPR